MSKSKKPAVISGRAAEMPEGRRFKPGQSGNPTGRPKTPPELVEAFQARTERALATLDKIMDDYEANKETAKGDPWVPASAAAKAAEVILARGWGAPPVKVDLAAEVKVEGTVEVQKKLVIDPEKMRRVAAVLLRAGVLRLEGE